MIFYWCPDARCRAVAEIIGEHWIDTSAGVRILVVEVLCCAGHTFHTPRVKLVEMT